MLFVMMFRQLHRLAKLFPDDKVRQTATIFEGVLAGWQDSFDACCVRDDSRVLRMRLRPPKHQSLNDGFFGFREIPLQRACLSHLRLSCFAHRALVEESAPHREAAPPISLR